MSCHRKKFLATGGNFLPQEEISCHIKVYLVTRRFFVIGRNFLSQKEIYCLFKKFIVTGRKGRLLFGPDEAFLAPILSFLLRLSQSVDMVGQMCAFLRFQSFGQFWPFLDL